ncbi:MAG: phosphate acetyltransferase [Deltaproteobacteria bacterium]|nr:phosphate acetyltransferase [Deltaproteobacteria bacterium]
MKIKESEVLDYHQKKRPGKIEVVPTKPCVTQRDLSLAYTPGVAVPCKRIFASPAEVFSYTAKGNLVGVITNGTAVLGLGDIGPLAAKPVMEGKGILFKKFADIDVFDIEVEAKDPDEFIRTVQAIAPTFGGINLEDVRSPDCFYIEEKLRQTLDIPVFHDDQHGTAVIVLAALINALELQEKKPSKAKIVFSGAGAAAIGCADLMVEYGVKPENMILCDYDGVVYKGRKEEMNPYKERFATASSVRTLAEAMDGADVFIGLSVGGIVTREMVASMARRPVIFALANPDPEISYDSAVSARSDAIVATGRSDYPNQVNNVLGFPFIFRGALDVQAATINTEMKLAAAKALANLAKEDVPDVVFRAYEGAEFRFGPEYIIPKPFDYRVLLRVTPAVAKAAMESGAARRPITDLEAYRYSLEARLGRTRGVMREIINKAKVASSRGPMIRIVLPEGEEPKILRACKILLDEKIARPILLGERSLIEKRMEELELDLGNVEIIDPVRSDKFENYAQGLHNLRKRKGVTYAEAVSLLRKRNYFGSMMVHLGDADGLVSGLTKSYPDTIRPALQIIGLQEDVSIVAGLYIMILPDRIFFFADTTVNIEPTTDQLAEIAIMTADKAKWYGKVEPRVALLSFSNFGSTKHPTVERIKRAAELAQAKRPDLVIDGEMQADTAVIPEIAQETYPFSRIRGDANVLIFPDLEAGNIAYKLLQRLGKCDVIGPILMGMARPVHVLQRNADVNEIVNIAAIAVIDAKELARSL